MRGRMIDSTLGQACSLVTDGTHDTPPTLPEGYPLIKAKEIVGGKIDFDNCAFISEREHLKVIARSKPEMGDTLFAHIGASLGEAAFVNTNRAFSIKNIALFKPNEKIILGRYLYYLTISPQFQAMAKSARTGSAQPFLSLGDLRGHRIRFHDDRDAQAFIVSILSAYDDLIENNTRRIKILEEMAQLIYREWFVNFRFPGHENTKMVESELGMIPEGWEVKPIGEVIQTLGGSTPSTKNSEYWEDGDVIWFIPSDLTRTGSMFMFDSEKKITRIGLKNCSARLFPPYSVMMTSRATIGVTAINTKEACTNQGFITCIPNEQLSAHHIYYWIQENFEKINSIASGATYKEINRTEFRSLPIIVPDSQIEHLFLEIMEPIGKQMKNLLARNANLRTTRDLLLPKLISGELDVEKLHIDIGEVPA